MSSVYTKKLPDSIIAFSSLESRTLLAQSITDGTAAIYFPLAQQYLTQSEPAYCGIATLCMILNAASIDPLQTWKGVWRWFDQEMLNCCRSLESIQLQGVTMAELVCLARCNGLDAISHSSRSLEEFRRDVIRVCRSEDEYMAVSYGRQALGQTGTGHFRRSHPTSSTKKLSGCVGEC